jgi:hypothetical protein
LIFTDTKNPDVCNWLQSLGSVRVVFFNSHLTGSERNLALSDQLLDSAEDVDFIFCLGSRILRGALLTQFENRIINVHPSILPAFRGMRAIDQALEQKALLLGMSFHFIDERLDEGIIILQFLTAARNFRGNYFSVLDAMILGLGQIFIWLRENRLILENGRCWIEDGVYRIGQFVPSLESDLLKYWSECDLAVKME